MRWLLTVYDQDDQVVEEEEYGTLRQIAKEVALPRGNDPFRYRPVQYLEHARQLMLSRVGVWFTIDDDDEAEDSDRSESESDDDDSNMEEDDTSSSSEVSKTAVINKYRS